MNPDVLIIGAGVVGLTTALSLHQAGLSVTVVDRQRPGQESSWAGGGILSPLYPWRYPDSVTKLSLLGQQSYPTMLDRLASASATHTQWYRGGFLSLNVADADAAADWAKRFGVAMQFLDDKTVREMAGCLAFEDGQSAKAHAFLPDVAQVRTPRLSRALYEYLLAQGVGFVLGSAVQRLLVSDARVEGVLTAKGRVSAGKVVVAAGAWTSTLVDDLGLATGIRPIKGQMLLFRAAPGLLKHIVIRDGRYLIPRRDGRILIGSTLEDAGFDKTLSDAANGALRQAAIDLLPALADVELEHHWAGLRPGRAGDVPIVSAHPDVQGLFVNAGHYRNGVVLAPGSAQLLASLVVNSEPPVNSEPYRLQALEEKLVV